MEHEFQVNDAINSAQDSPRRRKVALDLDAALYLQSQATLVQEPNKTGLASRKLALIQQQAGQKQSSNSNSNFNLDCRPNIYWGPVQQQQQATRISSGAYNNISVDYIDCISNNDLTRNAPTSNQTTATALQHLSNYNRPSETILIDQTDRTSNFATMGKGFGHCRKHLRFHKNRIDPKTPPISNHQAEVASNNLSLSSAEDLGNGLRPRENSFGAPQEGEWADSQATKADGTSNMSYLYPISVDEAKERTYFIGSLNQDSLLGNDELHKYFPNSRVSIFVCTWNQNRRRTPMNLNDLLMPDKLNYLPDIYAIGIQEAFSYQTDYLKEWEIDLQTTLGPNHVLLHSCSLGVLHLSIFIRRDLIWFCSIPESSVYNSRSMPTNMLKTKGAISIAFRFFGTSFMFTNCHFPAHENKLKDRIDEYQRIIQSIDLPKNLKLLKPRYLSNDSTARFDCVFFMGDLNFRLEQRSFDETVHILEDIFQQLEAERAIANQNPSGNGPPLQSSNNNNNRFDILTQNDELLKVMETQQAFHGFDESQIKFPPTYKFLAKTNKYDRQTKRVPSYTDRILFRSKRQKHIQCLLYDWLPQLLSSDHKPVYCLFDVLIRPGHEQNGTVTSLNAGLFQRTIYLEALKRRAELNPEAMRESGNGGSLICSIS